MIHKKILSVINKYFSKKFSYTFILVMKHGIAFGVTEFLTDLRNMGKKAQNHGYEGFATTHKPIVDRFQINSRCPISQDVVFQHNPKPFHKMCSSRRIALKLVNSMTFMLWPFFLGHLLVQCHSNCKGTFRELQKHRILVQKIRCIKNESDLREENLMIKDSMEIPGDCTSVGAS